MARVTIHLSSVLAGVVQGHRRFEVEGGTVRDALEALFAERPELRVHLFEETGGLRPHVLCFHNEVNTRWEDDLEQPTGDGDQITIMQAVSGG